MQWWLTAFGVALFLGVRVYAADVVQISNVLISDISLTTATVKWSTDVKTDATINYGLDSNTGLVRDPTFDLKDHQLTITNLDPGTQYHFRVISTDDQGNKSATAGFVFTTRGTPAQKIQQDIKKITDPEQLKEIEQAVQDQAQDQLRPPSIIGSPKIVAESDYAVFTWTTDRESGSQVQLASEAEYNAQSANPYTISQGASEAAVTKHTVKVVGLKPSTVYHFKIYSKDSFNLIGTTEDDTFRTKSILPKIANLKVTRVQEDSATVSWSTGDVLAKGTVEYKNNRTKRSNTTGDPLFTTTHTVKLGNLEFGTRYTAVITATNQGGDQVVSDPFTFLTVRDVIPPAIAKVKNESTLFPGDEVKVQTIVTWVTDEPTFCTVFYTQGLGGPGSKVENAPRESNPLTDHTSVIVGFVPGTVYKYWVECDDVAGNNSRSEDFVLITPIKEKNIIDIILENFQGTFGWVNKVGK